MIGAPTTSNCRHKDWDGPLLIWWTALCILPLKFLAKVRFFGFLRLYTLLAASDFCVFVLNFVSFKICRPSRQLRQFLRDASSFFVHLMNMAWLHYCQFVSSHEFAEYFRRIRIFHSQSSSMNSANERIRMRKFSGSHTNWFIPTFHILTKIFACENLVWNDKCPCPIGLSYQYYRIDFESKVKYPTSN